MASKSMKVRDLIAWNEQGNRPDKQQQGMGRDQIQRVPDRLLKSFH